MKTFEKKKRVQEGNMHVYLRGNSRNTVFYDDIERIVFIMKLHQYAITFGVKIFAFVLMDNHVHLQIYTNRLTEFMRTFLHSYVRWYNKKNDGSGNLFCSPFGSASKGSKSWHIDRILYILQNPVKHGVCQHPSEYKWSSYSFRFNQKNPLRNYIKVDTSLIQAEFETKELLDRALLQKTLSITEFNEDFNNSKTCVPDEEIATQMKSNISGLTMSQMRKTEMKDLIRFLYFSANATIRQISSLTHENHSYITRILKEKNKAVEKFES
ncbi:MAG: transposase [uncultured bacterium]|nr:MAG: transposase [uncultured bacterium]HBY02883.1 hypothetical protein [Rikenellaceae bacterium]